MAKLTLSLDNSKSKVLLTADLDDGAVTSDAEIEQAFQSSDFSRFYFLEDASKNAVSEINQVLTEKKQAPACEFEIAERRGAKIKIKVGPDKMVATAEITAAYAGRPLTAKQIKRCALQVGVDMGHLDKNMEKLALAAETAEPGTISSEVIAKGQAPKNGKDSQFESLVESIRDRILRPQETEHGKVDMRDLGSMISVSKGEQLMRRHKPTLGKPGYNVKGDPVHPTPGETLEFEVGEGVIVCPKDADLLIADMDGLPHVLDTGMRIDNVITLPGVDVSTGHIDFAGGVIVNGDVTEGMKLIASGDVTITGFVDNAFIEVDGDVTVVQGIVGRKVDEDAEKNESDFNCVVKATGTIAAKYMQNAYLSAGKDLIAQAQMMHCQTESKRLYGGHPDRPNGKIVGGHHNAHEFVIAGMLGAPASTHTDIILFPEYAELEARRLEIAKSKHKCHGILKEIKTAWDHLRALPNCEKKEGLLEKTLASYKEQDQTFKQLKHNHDELEQLIAQASSKAKVQVLNAFYSKVKVSLGKHILVNEVDQKACDIVLGEQGLVKR